jgi:hypothetical protein
MEFLSIYECPKQEDLTLYFTLPRDVQTVVVLDRDLSRRKSGALIHLTSRSAVAGDPRMGNVAHTT